MFYKNASQFIEACYQELLESKNENIQKGLKYIKKYVPKERHAELLHIILREHMSKLLVCGLKEEEFEDVFSDIFLKMLSDLKNTTKSIRIQVALSRQEKNVYRIMELPYILTVADFAYMILAAFQAEASHLFMIEHKKNKYLCNADPNDFDYDSQYAEDVLLASLNLRKNSKLTLWYDFGDDYLLDIKVLEVKEHGKQFAIMDSQITEGKGYGIWEDAHHELDMFYDDPIEFNQYVDEIGNSPEDYPIDEFDIDQANEMLLDDFDSIKKAYEANSYE